MSDCRLPGMDGLQLLKAVKSIQPRIKTLLDSGPYSSETLQLARMQGLDNVLGKPIHIQELLAAIQCLSLPVSGPGPAIFKISGRDKDVTP